MKQIPAIAALTVCMAIAVMQRRNLVAGRAILARQAAGAKVDAAGAGEVQGRNYSLLLNVLAGCLKSLIARIFASILFLVMGMLVTAPTQTVSTIKVSMAMEFSFGEEMFPDRTRSGFARFRGQ